MKNITYILLLFSLSVFGQRPNRFNDSTYFARPVRFEVPPYLIQGAGSGKVITSDANGRMTWQTFSNSGVSQGALNDSINAVRSIRKVDTLYRNLDSLVFKINGIRYAIKDSSGGGVTQQALNDSIARLDSTINAIPTPLLTLTDDSLNISGGNTIELPYIPLSGTEVGKPVTGDIVTANEVNLKVANADNTDFNYLLFGENNISITNTNNGDGYISEFRFTNNGIEVVSNNPIATGITGLQDYTPNITDLDYPQKIYVDQRISDTATQIRSEIPDVSNFATITNLADTSALLRSLIPTTATFTISKNSEKDSIITIFNGVRSAVKDSTANLTNYVTNSSTSILTNKRITARVDSTTSSATPTINTDNVDTYKLTAQAADITSFTTNLSGTPTDDQILHIVIIGTATRAITWGSKFEASTVALPTTTVGTDRLDVYFIWNTNTSKWRCGGVW